MSSWSAPETEHTRLTALRPHPTPRHPRSLSVPCALAPSPHVTWRQSLLTYPSTTLSPLNSHPNPRHHHYAARMASKILKEKYKHIDREYLLQEKALMASEIRQALGYAGSGRTPAPPRPRAGAAALYRSRSNLPRRCRVCLMRAPARPSSDVSHVSAVWTANVREYRASV